MGSITKKMFCQVEKMCNEIDDDIIDDIIGDINDVIKNLDDTNDDIIMMTSKILMTPMMTS